MIAERKEKGQCVEWCTYTRYLFLPSWLGCRVCAISTSSLAGSSYTHGTALKDPSLKDLVHSCN
jgi:hypothetical protein